MNLNRIKLFLKNNEIIDTILRVIGFPYFWIEMKHSEYEMSTRQNNRGSNEYSYLREYKDKYKGKRCFVVACGPSLTMKDLELIKEEFSFGMNSDVLAFEDTSWRPTWYAIQDTYVYERLEKAIVDCDEKDLKNVLVSNEIFKYFDVPSRFNKYYLNLLDHKMWHKRGWGTFKFSSDCSIGVYDAYSVTFSILQLASYMGFKEIYLLGCDCNYRQAKKHFIDNGYQDPKAEAMGDKIIAAHEQFKKYADKHGIKVVNCTRGGILEVYPRKKLEDVIKES